MIGIESHPLNRYLIDMARNRRRDHQQFVYQGATSVAGAGAADTNSFAVDIDNDAPFLFTELHGEAFSTDAGATTPLQHEPYPAVRLMLRYGGPGGQAWAQTPVHWRNILGYRPVPYVLPVPRLVPAGSQLHMTVFGDLEPGGDGNLPNLQLVFQFVGTKLFRWRAA